MMATKTAKNLSLTTTTPTALNVLQAYAGQFWGR